jgi:hypothetical protein
MRSKWPRFVGDDECGGLVIGTALVETPPEEDEPAGCREGEERRDPGDDDLKRPATFSSTAMRIEPRDDSHCPLHPGLASLDVVVGGKLPVEPVSHGDSGLDLEILVHRISPWWSSVRSSGCIGSGTLKFESKNRGAASGGRL